MELVGEIVVGGAPEEVWALLVDPEVLRQCIPGCAGLEVTEPDTYAGKMVVKVGPVSATFSGVVSLTGIDHPRTCTLNGQGQGGAAGFAKGSAVITLEAAEAGTRVAYTANVQIGGKLASVGNRLFGSVAKRNIEDFFAKFEAISGKVSEPI